MNISAIRTYVLIRAEADTGRRLNPRKADLLRWRERFAAELRAHGIDAAATRQAARGVIKAPRELWQVRAAQEGRWINQRPELKTDATTISTRAGAVTRWQGIVAELRTTGNEEDRKLAAQAEAFVRAMPVAPYLPTAAADQNSNSGEQHERGIER